MYKFSEPIYITRPLLPRLAGIHDQLFEIWENKQVTNHGVKHAELQRELAAYLNVDQLVLFANGTLALLLGLKALQLHGEVITTPFTFPATLQALDWNGLTPVFCDIDPVTLNIDVSHIESLITDKTSAILGVHVFGNPCNMTGIQQIADKYNLKVIYDGAHAFGSYIDGKPIGSYGDMTMFSFHATKLFHTIEGGALTYKDKNLTQQLNQLKNFGLDDDGGVALSGLNAKMNEIQASVGLEVLKLIGDERLKRDKVMDVYQHMLGEVEGITIYTKLRGQESSYQYFVIGIHEKKFGRSRDWVHEELKTYNVFTKKYFYPLCSTFHWYNHLESAQPDKLAQAHSVVEQALALPLYGDLDIQSAIHICEIIRSFKK